MTMMLISTSEEALLVLIMLLLLMTICQPLHHMVRFIRPVPKKMGKSSILDVIYVFAPNPCPIVLQSRTGYRSLNEMVLNT